jgi:hypothetical protein
MRQKDNKFWFWVWLVQITVPKQQLKTKKTKGEVWRNLVVVAAENEKEAVRKAISMGKMGTGDSEGSLRLDGRPAVSKFIGIEDMGLIHEPIGDGCEILFRSSRQFLDTVRERIKSVAEIKQWAKDELSPYKKMESEVVTKSISPATKSNKRARKR